MMESTKLLSNRSKVISVIYFAIYVSVCIIYWQIPNNYQVNGNGANIHTGSTINSIAITEVYDLLNLAIDHHPSNENLHFNLEELGKLENTISALEHQLRASCKKQPNNVIYLNNHAGFLLEAKKYKKAEEHLIKAVSIAPTFGDSEVLLMELYHRMQNWDQLQQLAYEIIQNKAYTAIAKRYLEIAKRKITIIDILEEDIIKHPSPLKYLQLSRELYYEGRFAESFHHINQALQEQQDFSVARLQLSLVYSKLGEQQRAIKTLKTPLQFGSELHSIKQKLSILDNYSNSAVAYH